MDLLAAWGRWMATRPEDPTAGFVRRPSSPPPRPRPAPKSGSSLCPADGTPLIAGPEPYAAVRLCPTCHGCFLPRGLFERLRSDPASLDGIEAVVPTAEVKPEAPRYRRCPICNEQMARRNFERVSGVIVDICPTHGTWFDAGELEAARGFVRGGAGPAARAAFEAREAEWQARQTETMREWERRLTSRSTTMWGGPDDWDS